MAEDEEVDADVIISCENVHKTYLMGLEGVPALRGVNLDIRRGEWVAIYGTSGGGKTSLLNVLGTIDTPTRGNLMVCGKRITARTTDAYRAALRLRHIGFVFQSFNLLPTLTAVENVTLPMSLLGRLTPAQRAARASELLARVGLAARAGHLPAQLSGGEQQRVTIARALANSPSMLLLDEPTGDLDTANTARAMDIFWELNRDDGITLVMVTHDPSLKALAHRAVYLRDGKVAAIETATAEAREAARHELQQALAARDVGGGHATAVATPGGAPPVEVRTPASYSLAAALRPAYVARPPPPAPAGAAAAEAAAGAGPVSPAAVWVRIPHELPPPTPPVRTDTVSSAAAEESLPSLPSSGGAGAGGRRDRTKGVPEPGVELSPWPLRMQEAADSRPETPPPASPPVRGDAAHTPLSMLSGSSASPLLRHR